MTVLWHKKINNDIIPNKGFYGYSAALKLQCAVLRYNKLASDYLCTVPRPAPVAGDQCLGVPSGARQQPVQW